jgi:hypothetical protein
VCLLGSSFFLISGDTQRHLGQSYWAKSAVTTTTTTSNGRRTADLVTQKWDKSQRITKNPKRERETERERKRDRRKRERKRERERERGRARETRTNSWTKS